MATQPGPILFYHWPSGLLRPSSVSPQFSLFPGPLCSSHANMSQTTPNNFPHALFPTWVP